MSDPSNVGIRQGQLVPTWTTPARSVQRTLKNHEVKSESPSGRAAVVDQLATWALNQPDSPRTVRLTAADHFHQSTQPENLLKTAGDVCVLNEDLLLLGNVFDEAEEEYANMRHQAHEASHKIGEERYNQIKELKPDEDEKQNAFINANKDLIRETTKLDQAKAKLATFEQSSEKHELDTLKKQVTELQNRKNKLEELSKNLNPTSQEFKDNQNAIDINATNLKDARENLRKLNTKYINLQSAVDDAQQEYQTTQANYEAAREELPDTISQQFKNYDETKAAIKFAFESYSHNPSDTSRTALMGTLENVNNLTKSSTTQALDEKLAAINPEYIAERDKDKKSDSPSMRSVKVSDGLGSLRSASAPTVLTSAQTTDSRPAENAPREAAHREAPQPKAEDRPSTSAPATSAATTTAPEAQNIASQSTETKTPSRPNAAANLTQPAEDAASSPASSVKPPPIPPRPVKTATPESAPLQSGQKNIDHQVIQEQRNELQDLRQKLVELSKPVAIASPASPTPGGQTVAQTTPGTELPVQLTPNPQIAPLIAHLDILDKQLSSMQQKLKTLPEAPPQAKEAPAKQPSGQTAAGPTAQERLQQQQQKQAEATKLLNQAQEARKQATTLIAQEEYVRRSGVTAAETAARASEETKAQKEERQPQPAAAAAADESGDQRQGEGRQQQQQQQQRRQQPAKPEGAEARVGQKAFAEGFTGTIETHQWGSTAHLIKTIGGKEFHVTFDFYNAVDENKVNEFLRERGSMEKIDRMMKEYNVFSDLGKKDFVLESTYSGGTQMRYTGKGNASKTVDLAYAEGFLKGKLQKYDDRIANAARDPARVATLETKKIKVTNVLNRYLNKPVAPGVTVRQAAPAAAQTPEAKQPARPTQPLPARPIHAELDEAYKTRINGFQKEKEEAETKVKNDKKKMEDEKAFALDIDNRGGIAGQPPEKISQLKELLKKDLETPSESRNIQRAEYNNIIPDAFAKLSFSIDDFLKAEKTFQNSLAELDRKEQILQDFKWMQAELNVAQKSIKGSKEAKNEFLLLKTYLTNQNNEYIAANQEIMRQRSPSPQQQSMLNELRRNQLEALRAFNNVQAARNENDQAAVSARLGIFHQRITPLRNAA